MLQALLEHARYAPGSEPRSRRNCPPPASSTSQCSATRRIGGRTYDLYYDGAKLHMVVLRTPRASYWVVNTLLDRLSNETMIAIAKGLAPLGKAR